MLLVLITFELNENEGVEVVVGATDEKMPVDCTGVVDWPNPVNAELVVVVGFEDPPNEKPGLFVLEVPKLNPTPLAFVVSGAFDDIDDVIPIEGVWTKHEK